MNLRVEYSLEASLGIPLAPAPVLMREILGRMGQHHLWQTNEFSFNSGVIH